MRSIIAILTVAIFSPVLLMGQSASGAEKMIRFPTPQATSPQQPVVPHPTFEDIRPSGPSIALAVSAGTLLHLQDAVRYVFIADNDIADVQVEQEQPKLIYVTAKKPGRTVLYAVDNAGYVLLNKAIRVIDVSIDPVAIILLRHKLTGDPAHVVLSGRNCQFFNSQKPRRYWVSATCDAVRLEVSLFRRLSALIYLHSVEASVRHIEP